MQIVMQVYCKGTKSLRKRIQQDVAGLEDFGLKLDKSKWKQDGWARIKPAEPEVLGTVSVEWETKTRSLLCRFNTKGGSRSRYPGATLLGLLTEYLYARFANRIEFTTIHQLK